MPDCFQVFLVFKLVRIGLKKFLLRDREHLQNSFYIILAHLFAGYFGFHRSINRIA